MRTLPLLWTAALTVACSGTEPVELADAYDLHTVAGGPPPRLVGATVECDVSVEGGRVTFGPADQFELVLDVLTDCARGGGSPSRQTLGYTGTADASGRQVVFHTGTGAAAISFEGEVVAGGHLQVSVPRLVPTAEHLDVEFAPN